MDGGKTVKGGIQIQPDRQDRSHTPQWQRDDNRIRTPGPEDRANQMIREAEMVKARIFNQSGEKNQIIDNVQMVAFNSIAQMDQDYLLVGNHVDQLTQTKIVRGNTLILAN